MMKSCFKTVSKSVLVSRVKCRTFSISSANAQKRLKLVNTCAYFKNYNFTSFNNRQLLNSNNITVLSSSGFLTSKNVRHFSSVSVDENLEIVSKFLEGTPVDWYKNLLIWSHSTTGFPWWATIILNAVVFRICIITPITLYQVHTAARLQNVQLEMDGFVHNLRKRIEREAQINQWSKATAKRKYYVAIRQEMQKMYIRDNCHPLKLFGISMMYLAVFICQTIAIRNLCFMLPISDSFAKLTQLELSVGGFGWITNLNEVDNYYIFPIYLGILSYCLLETKYLLKKSETPAILMRKIQQASIFVIPIISLLISSNMPAAVILSWTTNSTLSYMEMLFLATPKVRRLFGIPKTVEDFDRPFAVLKEKIKAKYRLP